MRSWAAAWLGEAVGDICVGGGCCDFFVTEQIASLLQNFWRRRTRSVFPEFTLQNVTIAPAQTKKLGHPSLPAAGRRHFLRVSHRAEPGFPGS